MTPLPTPGLFETLRLQDGTIPRLDLHLARLTASARSFDIPFAPDRARDELAAAVRGREGTTRVRLTLDPDGTVHIELAPLPDRPFRTAWVCPDPMPEAGGPLCRHKTTARDHYETRFRAARAAGADEAIVLNGAGEVCEGTRSNVWIERAGRLWTPPLASGGLGGVERAHLLATRPDTAEAVLTPADLWRAPAVYLSNALRGLMRVGLVSGRGPEASPVAGSYPVSPSRPFPMTGLLGTLAQSLGGQQMNQLANAIGADERTTQQAVGAALPAILAALNRNTNSTQGAQALNRALERDHDGSLLDNLGGFLGGQMSGKQADGAGILGHLLGARRPQLEEGVAKASGLDLSQVARLLPILAPIVMAALGRQKRQAGLDEAGLSGLLGAESTIARREAPSGLMGALSGFLDQDGDGSIQDDLMAQAGRAALGKLFGR